MFYQTLNLENKRQIFCPQLQFLIVPISSDTRYTYIYFVIYIEIIRISVYHTSFKRKRANRIFSQGSQVSIGWNHALGLAAYVLEQRQRQRAVRSAQKYSTRASPSRESNEDRVRGWISPFPISDCERVWFHRALLLRHVHIECTSPPRQGCATKYPVHRAP